MKWIPTPFGRHQRILYVVKGENSNGYMNATRLGNYMLDWGRTTTCSRNKHIAGGVPIYVKMNINYD